MKTLPQYKVRIDAETGEWLGEPEYVGKVDPERWYKKKDTHLWHYDCYEAPIKDSVDTETRAIACMLVRDWKDK